MSNTKIPGVTRFDPNSFGSESDFAVIGSGELGGKASGLRQIREEILPRFEGGDFEGVSVSVPQAVVIATDVFSAFMERNGLWKITSEDLPDSRIAREFQGGELPAGAREDLHHMLGVMTNPLAIRPSSYLEDVHDRAFTGCIT